jgi:hypothetical protein
LEVEMNPSLPRDFYTWESLGTLAIAAGAVLVVSNTLRTLFRVDSPWIPFGVSVVLAVLGAHAAGGLTTAPGWILALLNACLLFCTATGANQTLVAAASRRGGERRVEGERGVGWLSSWLR